MSDSKHSGPIPPLPAKIVLPNIAVTRKEMGSFQVPPTPTFYYAGIQSLWLWYKVPLATLRAYLNPLEMTPYDFGGTGAVNINFFNAAAMYGMGQPGNQGIGGFNETEVNIVGYATKIANTVQQGLTLEQYLTLGDVTKRVGNYRVWVACDDAIAVAAGRQVFMENKFLTPYTYNVPSLNNQKAAPGQFTWDWQCMDPTVAKETIYGTTVNLDGLSAVPGYMTEVIDLSYDKTSQRPVASRRNFLGMFDTFLQPGVAKAVTMTYGKSEHPMRHDMEKLVGQHRAVAIQRFESPPCILEAAGYYADE
jgi:hypothetical protein